MTNEKETLTTKEAAELLKVQPSTIHKYVKDGKLEPVYVTNWQIDATKLFFKEDIEKLKQEFSKPGITTGEAAELLGIHHTTISQYIQKGLIKAEKKPYKGRDIYFIEPEEIENFKSTHEFKRKKEQKEFFDKETGFAWFQSFTDVHGNQNNRILLDGEGEALLVRDNGKKITLNNIVAAGYSPVVSIPDIDYISKRGYAKFIFNQTDLFYSIIELFYLHLGPKNMKVSLQEDRTLKVEIKPIYIKSQLPNEILQELRISLLEGSISNRLDGIVINSDLETITVAVPSELKELIRKEAEVTQRTIEEVVLSVLKDKFSSLLELL
jgi:excisionase family DNA binding protein